MGKNLIINSHCHLFNSFYIPEVFMDRYTKGFNPKFLKFITKIADNPFKEEDLIEKLGTLLKIALQKDIIGVTQLLIEDIDKSNHADEIIFTPLMMDFRYSLQNPFSQSEIPEKNFQTHVKEMSEIVLKFPGRFLPFIAADPRRIEYNKWLQNIDDPDGIKYIVDALEKQGFWGIKIYPPLGYIPNDSNYDPLFAYCQKNAIPITTHCSFGGSYCDKPVPDGINQKKRNYYREFANPDNWVPVLERYPDLTLNFGHFGGDLYAKKLLFFKDKKQIEIEKDWHKKVIALMQNPDFPNLYADLSYHVAIFEDTQKYFDRLCSYFNKLNIGEKILYGTDWWVSRVVCSENKYIDFFRQKGLEKNRLTVSQMDLLLSENSINFLNLRNKNSKMKKHYLEFLNKNGKQLPDWFPRELNSGLDSTS